jgi:GMP synthase (glutamine-hydrolysing)
MEKIIILDFGSQYTQLIARSVREENVYCEIQPFSKPVADDPEIKGVILSGSPSSVNDENAPLVAVHSILEKYPVLGICYGAQLTAKLYGGLVEKSNKREYGRAILKKSESEDILLKDIDTETQIWMSHADSITTLHSDFEIIATTDNIPVAAFKKSSDLPNPFYGLQFHPEVYHSTQGKTFIKNFLFGVCKCSKNFTSANFIEQTIQAVKDQVGGQKVIMAISGGVDSTVAAMLIHKAIGKNLYCIFVDNGLLRKNEYEQVIDTYRHLGLNIKGVDARKKFYSALHGISNPEDKRKAIGNTFIEVFEEQARYLKDIHFLGQGTIYPDVIESVSVHGPSVTIKSHHNVGGLPEKMRMQLVEPLKLLFKDEVRRVGLKLGISGNLIHRHPFPGPGLGIRILGAVDEEKVRLLQDADDIFIKGLKTNDLYDQVWQAGAMLLPVQSVGVMGDERTYEFTIALRAVTSVDGMTADWAKLPYDFLAGISNEIINNVKGINRVVYDISSKPPATIEWE